MAAQQCLEPWNGGLSRNRVATKEPSRPEMFAVDLDLSLLSWYEQLDMRVNKEECWVAAIPFSFGLLASLWSSYLAKRLWSSSILLNFQSSTQIMNCKGIWEEGTSQSKPVLGRGEE